MAIKSKLIPIILSTALLGVGAASLGVSTKHAIEVSAINYTEYEEKAEHGPRGEYATSINVGDVVVICAGYHNYALTGVTNDSTVKNRRGTAVAYTDAPYEGMKYRVIEGKRGLCFADENNMLLTYLDDTGGNHLTLSGIGSKNNYSPAWKLQKFYDTDKIKLRNTGTSDNLITGKWLRFDIKNNVFGVWTVDNNKNDNNERIRMWKFAAAGNAADQALTFTDQAMAKLNNVCDPDGNSNTDSVKSAWDAIKIIYDSLDDGTRAYLAATTPDEHGEALQIYI